MHVAVFDIRGGKNAAMKEQEPWLNIALGFEVVGRPDHGVFSALCCWRCAPILSKAFGDVISLNPLPSAFLGGNMCRAPCCVGGENLEFCFFSGVQLSPCRRGNGPRLDRERVFMSSSPQGSSRR